ncbi:MAG: methyltransferase domain-containing protein [Cyanobacteria bacterium P01_G01_bin.39]
MNNLTAQAWSEKYQSGGDRWDLGCPSPPLINLLASEHAPQPGKMAVLGCGRGHDALLFAEAGFEVIGFDFATIAIAEATATAQARNIEAQFIQQDIFNLDPEFANSFDYVLEHTCFCAIDPDLRGEYVEVVKSILRPQGKLIAMFYTHNRPGGPPFGVKPQEVLDYFTPYFEPIVFRVAPDSIARRQGNEHLAIFQLKSR